MIECSYCGKISTGKISTGKISTGKISTGKISTGLFQRHFKSLLESGPW